MTTALAKVQPLDMAGMETLLLKGNLEEMTPQQRMAYYRDVCESMGLNPLTRPFGYLKLQNGLQLYALRNCTDQIRATRGISTTIVDRTQTGDLYIVTARATAKDGRTDEDVGAVSTSSLRGEALANAIMKAHTKAKRRVTLGICGLSIPDESEVDSIPGAVRMVETPDGKLVPDGAPVAPHPSTPAVNVQALVDGFAASTDGATYRAACKAVEAVWGALDGDARNATQAARDTAKARILASRPATTDLAPISEPLEQAAKRAAIAASLRTESRPFGTYDHEDNPITGEPGGIPDEPDEPPTDEELAEALWSPVVNANPKDEAQLTALWATVMTSPSYKAATEGARRLAAETIEGVRATLRDAKPKGGRK